MKACSATDFEPATRMNEWQQRQALFRLAASAEFLKSTLGQRFVLQLRQRFVPPVLAAAQRAGVGNHWLSADDIVHTMLLKLCEHRGKVARKAAAAHAEPWAYLMPCVLRWSRELWGTRCLAIGELDVIDPDGAHEGAAVTGLEDVIDLVYQQLAPAVSSTCRSELKQLLRWIAHNPPQRPSHEARDRAAARDQFRGLTPACIDAVMLVALGSRPNRPATSLMGAYLLNADFDPAGSATHAAALLRFRRTVRRAEVHGRLDAFLAA